MSDSIQRVNAEISEIKTKQSMLSTIDSKKEEEQRNLAESLRKPA